MCTGRTLYRNMTKKQKKRQSWLISCGVFFVIILAWYLVTKYTNVSKVILPSPEAVIDSMKSTMEKGYGTNNYTLVVHYLSSMQRLLFAFLLVLVTAIPIGVLCGRNRIIMAVINPLIEFYRPLPPLAYYTLLVLWMGIGEESKITLLYLAGFAPLYIACAAGVARVKKDKINGAYMLGAGKGQVLVHVILPAILPDVFTGIKTALGVEYTTLVAAEMVAATSGIGWMVLDASRWLRSDVVFLGVIIMGITGIIFNIGIDMIERRVVHWKGKI